MTPYAVETIGLGKTFRKKKNLRQILRRPFLPGEPVNALNRVDLRVTRGEIFGLLGPNGAGKTTLIKILSSLILPTEGRALVDSADCSHGAAARQRLGLVTSDERSFYWRLTGIENLRFFGRLHGLPADALRERIQMLLERVDLNDVAEKAFSTYSSGMRQRLALARALLHDPPVLLLDAPTRSLDPVAARSLRRFVKHELNGRDGKTVLLASHNLREAEVLCERIAILAKGRVLAVDTPENIRRFGLPEDTYRLEIQGEVPEGRPGMRVLGPAEEGAAQDGAVRVELTLRDGERLGDALSFLMQAGGRILSCDRIEPDLEEAFERIIADGPDAGSRTAEGDDSSGEGAWAS